MSRVRTLVLAVAAAVASLALAPGGAAAGEALSPAAMFEPLTVHGEWTVVQPYGLVWRPHVAGPGWRPYLDGMWVWTDDGWYWASDEPWAWATYHYGRWFLDLRLGWCWVPGDAWAPAWVAWRTGVGVVGWAPLGPGVTSWWIEPAPIPVESWVFVPDRHFAGVPIPRWTYPPARWPGLVAQTRPAPPRPTPRPVGAPPRPVPSPWAGGPSRGLVEGRTGAPVPAPRVVPAPSPGEARTPRDGVLRVYRPPPTTAPAPARAPAAAPAPATRVPAPAPAPRARPVPRPPGDAGGRPTPGR